MMTLTPPSPALGLVGAPYKRGGTDAAEGFDCFTLLAHVRRVYYGRKTPHAGIPSPALPAAQACALAIYRATGGREHLNHLWTPTDPVDGCAVAMANSKFRRLHHCGVLVADVVLHALNGCGVVASPLDRVWYLYPRVEFYECRSWS